MRAMTVFVLAPAALSLVGGASGAGIHSDKPVWNGASSKPGLRASHLSIDSIVVHPGRGLPVTIRATSGGIASLKPAINLRKSFGSDSIQKLRASALRVASVSKRGLFAVSNTLLVLDALEAPTKAEYHARIARLPVNIAVSPTPEGTRRDVYVRGRLKATLFITGQGASTTKGEQAGGGPAPTQPSEQFEGLSPAGLSPAAQQVQESSVGESEDYCEYTDDNGYWSGDCATEGDIDDAAATLASLDSDVDGYQADASDALAECQSIHPDPTVCAESHELDDDAAALEPVLGGPFDAAAFSGLRPCPVRPDSLATKGKGCATEAVVFVGEVVGFAASRVAAWGILGRGVAAVTAEVGWAVAGVIAASVLTGIGAAAYINCLAAT